ncbi:ABC transporter substrate-binding protein [Bradyrhizobium elkanii]|uniref:ABC transporter substrate-binding protein n=1 Tax=Bradyrhizobium elkanii TaxID=29448 RepID=UPI002714F238|nr:ABC transporter substrate-binding protein [Bradyrhizobium elkanii]WLB06273.1 ABC transporter substrate-binding protein [Bradyrhizobium elkanii]
MASRSITCMTLALLACSALLQPARAAEPGEAIRVGAVLPFSGGVELYGQQAKLGLDLAARDINAAGGILGRPVEVIYADDKTRPEAAAEAMRSLVEKQGVFAVVGPITSRNLNALVPIAESSKTPLFYATNYEGGKCSRYLFSFGAVPNQELGQLLPYMTRTFGNTYFLLGADRVWPHQMFGIAQPLIEKLGGKVVATKYTLGTETDFSPLIKEIAASKAKVLLFALKGDGMDFIRQADEAGLLKDITVAFLDCRKSTSASSAARAEHGDRGAGGRGERGSCRQGVRREGPRRCRRRCRGVELCDDALQHADRAEGGGREGRQARQGGDHRRDGGPRHSVADRPCHARSGSSRGDEHVHCQDAGFGTRAGATTRRDRAGAGVQSSRPLTRRNIR